MATEKKIALTRTYTGHGSGTRTAIVREPTGGLYLDHGEPYEAQRLPDSAVPIVIENREAIRAYIEACVTFEGETEPSAILRQLSVADIRAVKEAVLGFFERPGTSAPSSTFSPSAPDGVPSPPSD